MRADCRRRVPHVEGLSRETQPPPPIQYTIKHQARPTILAYTRKTYFQIPFLDLGEFCLLILWFSFGVQHASSCVRGLVFEMGFKKKSKIDILTPLEGTRFFNKNLCRRGAPAAVIRWGGRPGPVNEIKNLRFFSGSKMAVSPEEY